MFISIKKLKLQNLICFSGIFKLELNKGFNILVGNNETKKSTILDPIVLWEIFEKIH